MNETRETPALDPIIRITPTAKLLGVSRATVYRLVERGELPRPIKVSLAASGFRQSWLREFLDRRERESARQ